MNSLGNSNFGKLLLGGCGTQVGLVAACGLLAALALVCSICGLSNALTVGVADGVAFVPPQTTATVTPTPTSPVIASLIGQVQLLQGELEFMRSGLPAAVYTPPTATPTPPPVLLANQSPVNLRGGPGTEYNTIGTLPFGTSAPIVGRNQDSSWWLISAGDGLFAWVAANLVTASNVSDEIPVVTIPSLMVWGTPSSMAAAAVASSGTPISGTQTVDPPPAVPQGTPTAAAGGQRQSVLEMPAYKRLAGHLLIPPVSESVSPKGDQIAVTEKIKLYTVTTGGALSKIWFEDSADVGPMGNVVWSPDGDYLAFVIGYKVKYCKPCQGVVILRLADGQVTYLEHPNKLDLNAPRWTQDGQLMVNAFPGEPANGVAYIYDLSGKGQPAQGAYVLSASNEGQKWFPWQPGKTWLVGTTERADSYNAD